MHEPMQSYRNRLLQLLSRQDFNRMRQYLKPVALKYRQVLYEPDVPIKDVYFPTTGVVSIVHTMRDGSAAEVGTIGNEGVVGLPILLGDAQAPTGAYVQVPGSGLQLAADLFRQQLAGSGSMPAIMLRYTHAFFNQVALSAACNNFHSVEQRCCRWLLMTHDRVQSDQFILTHEFLAMMLGVQRAGVTITAGKLKQDKLIDYQRGHITILDRPALEKRSCECYATGKREFDRLLGPPLGKTTPRVA
jgi:CRP-like cAMP-binding protein